MLHLATVHPDTLGLLKKLMALADGSEFLVMKNMVYFDDAEQDDQPDLLDSTVTWPEVKNAIEKASRKF